MWRRNLAGEFDFGSCAEKRRQDAGATMTRARVSQHGLGEV
jgi:hypothetical protein